MRSNLAGLAIGVVTLLALWPLYDWVTNRSQKQTDDSVSAGSTATTAGSASDTAAGATVSGEAFYGDENDNTFIGTAGSDSLFGFAGNDSLTGAAGEDLLSGGTGTIGSRFLTGTARKAQKPPRTQPLTSSKIGPPGQTPLITRVVTSLWAGHRLLPRRRSATHQSVRQVLQRFTRTTIHS